MALGMYAYQARRWLLFAVLPALVIGLLAYAFTNREAKTYQATTTLYVEQPTSLGTGVTGGTDVFSSEALIPTYSQMLTSPVTADAANKVLDTRYPGYRLQDHSLTVGNPSDTSGGVQQATQLMDFSDQDTSPVRAADAANTTAAVFIKQVQTLQRARFSGDEKILQKQLSDAQKNVQVASQQLSSYNGPSSGLNNIRASLTAYEGIYQTLISSAQQFRVAKATALHGLKLFSPATPPTAPIAPHPLRIGLLLTLVGFLLGGAGILAYDYLDDTPRKPEEVEELAGAPILGTVERFNMRRGETSLVTAKGPASPVSEAFRMIRTNLQYIDIDHPPRTIVVTSASPQEGKSTTVSNLANVFAQAGRRVTIIDGDLRRPSLHRIFHLKRNEGLTNVLIGDPSLNGNWIQPTETTNLRLIPSGPLPPRPADLLGSGKMHDLLNQLKVGTDLVLIDSPPVMAVTDAAILSTLTDGVVLVIDPAKSKRRDLRRARESIETVGGKIIGVVINRLERRGSGYYYYQYQYNYNYGRVGDEGLTEEPLETVQENGDGKRSKFLRRKQKQQV